jgi:amino acid transporter
VYSQLERGLAPRAVAQLFLVRTSRVKPSLAQIILAYLGLVLLLLGVFHKAIGLSDTFGDPLVFVGIGCTFLSFIVYRRKKARLNGGESASAASPTTRRAVFWISLIAMISLSLPWWQPYTGIVLPFSTSMIVGIATFILSMILFIVGWRRGQRRSNQPLQPTAGRSDI